MKINKNLIKNICLAFIIFTSVVIAVSAVGTRISDDYVQLGDAGDNDKLTNTATVIVGQRGAVDYLCDGTDDYIEIEQAISYAYSNGGGIVQVMPGTYTIENVNVPSNVSIIGSGIDSTIFRGTSGNVDLFISGNYPNIGNCSNVVLRDFSIEGHSSAFTGSGTNVFYGGENIKILNVKINDCYGTGMLFRNVSNSYIENSIFTNNGADGIYLYDGSNSNKIDSNYVENNNFGIGVMGWETPGQNESRENNVHDNTIYQNAFSGIYIVQNSNNNIINNNYVIENIQHGIYLYNGVNGTCVSENQLIRNSYTNPNLYDGIRINANALGNHLINNYIDGGTSKTHRRSIALFGTVNDTVATGNFLYNANNSGFDYAGTYSFYNNLGESPLYHGNHATAPTPYGEGDGYYNTTDHTEYRYDGTTWQALW